MCYPSIETIAMILVNILITFIAFMAYSIVLLVIPHWASTKH